MRRPLDRDNIQIPLRTLLAFTWAKTGLEGWTYEAWERFAEQQDAITRVNYPGPGVGYIVSNRALMYAESAASVPPHEEPLPLVLSLFVLNSLDEEEESSDEAIDIEEIDDLDDIEKDNPEIDAFYRLQFAETVGIVQEVMGAPPAYMGYYDQEDYPRYQLTDAVAYWDTPKVRLRVELKHDAPGAPYLILIYLTPPIITESHMLK